jgi:hypothetical protein
MMTTLVTPSKEKEVLVLDHACMRACPHYFLGRPSPSSFGKSKAVAQHAYDLGYSDT